MKIYTEIVFTWKGDELVQTSETSFDYDGPITECKGGSSTTVVNTPPPKTPEEIEADRLRLEEMRRQNALAAQMLPGQQKQIDLMNQLLQYQLDHSGDLDQLHSEQLRLATLQVQQQIADSAMQEQLRPQQLQFIQNQNALALKQIQALGEATDFSREQNKYILAQLQDQARRIAARNAAYSPEEEAKAAAEEARRASRMGAISEEAAQIQLENLKRGNKPTDEELANINQAYDAAQAMGESDINRNLKQTLRTINEEVALASGLRPTDTPALRLSERAGEEAARAQGQLTTSIAGGRATARLNYPLAASQVAGQQASTLQGLTQGAANFQDELRLAAATNRQQAFSLPGSAGFVMPQSGPSPNLSFMSPIMPGYNAGAFGYQFRNDNPSTTTSNTDVPWWSALGGIGQAASGIGSFMTGVSRLFPGTSTPSDARLKTDIKRVGTTDAGVPVFTYRYKGSSVPTMGVMAQDVARVFPDAVAQTPSGYLAVDYSQIK